jgi:hypothetical protein
MPGPGLIGVYYQRGHYLRAGQRDDEHEAKFTEKTPLRTAPYILFFPNNFNAVARIDPGKGLDSVKQDVTIDPGWTFTGTVLGPDGEPLTGAVSWGTGTLWAEERERMKKSAEFTVRTFNPRRPRDVFFQHLEMGLIGVAQPPKENGGSIIVRMEPGAAVTARLVDADGKPRAEVKLEVRFRRNEDRFWGRYFPESIETDREGRFRLGALLPGYEYRLTEEKGELLFGGGLRSGQTQDLGDVQLKGKQE